MPTRKPKTATPEKAPETPKVTVTAENDERVVSLRPLLRELERFVLWMEADQGLHFQSHVTLVVQTRGARKHLLGHFAKKRWFHKEGYPIHEISIVAEQLVRDPLDVLGTLVHECVHLHNDEAGVEDCSKSGRHNKKFKSLAEDFGLVVSEPIDSRGFAYTHLSDSLREEIERSFVPDLAAFALFRDTVPPKEKAPTKNKKYQCACEPKPKTFRAAVEIHAVCQECGVEFELAA